MSDVTSNTGEDAQLIDMIERWTERELKPIVREYDHADRYPEHIVEQMKELGLFGATVSTEYGGLGLPASTYAKIVMSISSVWMSITGIFNSHLMLALTIEKFGTPEQKAKWLPKIASGEIRGGLALTEPDAGTDLQGIRMTARRDGDDYVINGTKMWITNSPDAQVIVVYAKTDASAGPRGITAFLVETDTPGFKVAQKLDKLGMRGSSTGELVFEDCEIPEESVLGGIGRGVNVLMSGLDYERAVLAGGPVGIMQAALDVVLPYIHERKQFGQSIGTFQLVQGKVADMYTEMNAARAYVYTVAKACDRGQTTRKDAAGAILFAAERATKIALDAIQLLGGTGYINESPTGRLLRDAKLYEIGAGTSEIRRMLIGREIFNETA